MPPEAAAQPPPPLNTYPEMPEDLVHCMSATEWRQRCELAAAYRIAYLHDWHENIFNHITVKLEGTSDEADGPHFLLNDFGTGFDEITACNLLKVTLEGIVVDQCIPPGRRTVNTGERRVFKPGYVLHSAIHGSRHDVNTIWHGHDLDATAVSQTKFGILPLSQEATFTIAKPSRVPSTASTSNPGSSPTSARPTRSSCSRTTVRSSRAGARRRRSRRCTS